MQRLASLLRGRPPQPSDDAELGAPLPAVREAPMSGADRLRAAHARLAAAAPSPAVHLDRSIHRTSATPGAGALHHVSGQPGAGALHRVSGQPGAGGLHRTSAQPGAKPVNLARNSYQSDASNRSSMDTPTATQGGSSFRADAGAAYALGRRPSLTRSSGGGTGARMPVASGEWMSRAASLKAASFWADAWAGASPGGGAPGSGTADASFLHSRWIVLPNERAWLIWFLVTLVGAVWTGVFQPYVIAFSRHPGLYPYNDAQAFIEYILFLVFAVDIAIRSRRAYYDDSGLVIAPRAIFRNYARTLLPLDILGVLPIDYILIPAIYGAGPTDARGARLLSLLGLLRMARLHRVVAFFRYLDFNLAISLVAITIVRNFVYVLFVVHWAACGLYYIARVHDPSFSTTFIGRDTKTLTTFTSTSERFLISFYWAVTTFATVGYGDFSPASNVEIVWTIVYMLFNVALAAYVIATFTLFIIRRDTRASSYRDRAASLRSWAGVNGLPPKLTTSMQEHLRLAFANEDIADERVLGAMPSSLRRRALRHLYLSTLRRCYLFAGARQRFVDAVLAASHVDLLMPGVTIVEDGDHVADLCVCVSGSLMVLAPGTAGALGPDDMPLLDSSVHGGGRLLTEGDAVGEVAFFTDVPHSGSVRTLTVSRLLCVPRDKYEVIAKDFPVGTRGVLENLRKRAQEIVDREFAGEAGAARLAAAPVGLQHRQASAEGSARGGTTNSGLTVTQERSLGDALRVKALAASALARADERRTQEFLSAASRGDATVVRLMLQQGTSPDCADYDKRTGCMLAAASGHMAVIDELLAAGCNVNAVDGLGGSALMEAIKHGQDAVVKKLLDAGAAWHMSTVETAAELCGAVFSMNLPFLKRALLAARPDAGDYDQRTPAHVAACESSLSAIKELAAAGADLNLPDRWGSTPLDEAIRVGAKPVVEYLVSVGAATLKHDQRVAEFLAAAARGDCDAIRHALANGGVDVNDADYDSRAGIHLAAKEHVAAVATLLGAGADPNLVDCFGGCAALEAIKARRRDILALLTAAGAHLPWSEAEAAGHLCSAVSANDIELLRLYLEAGGPGGDRAAFASSKEYDSRCPLAVAAGDGNRDAVAVLLDAGADVNLKDRWGATPLDEAVKAGHDDICALLTARGGRLGASDGSAVAGTLCDAAKRGDLDLIRRLADAGANLSAAEYDLRTVAHIGACCSVEVVEFLIARGADFTARDRWGGTPLSEAKREGRADVVRVLEAAGITE